MPDVAELRVALTVADFDEALAFYRDAPVTTPWGIETPGSAPQTACS